MKAIYVILGILAVIVFVFVCGLFSLLQQIGSAGPAGHTTETSAFFTGIGLLAFLVWFLPIFGMCVLGYFIVKFLFLSGK